MECPNVDLQKSINDLNNALDYCEINCFKYYSCDTVALLNDRFLELEEH